MTINNKKMSTKQGFTLIELLGVIAIISILSGVAIISVTRLISKNRTNYYTSQEKMVTLAGKNYAQDYKTVLPKEVGKIQKIKLRELQDKNYLSSVVDYKKESCYLDESYVLIHKTSQNKYKYYAYLDCPDYNSDKNIKTNSSDITITLNDTNNYTNPTATVNITNPNGIASYNYIVYRNNKEIKNSGNIKNEGVTTEKTFTVNFNKYKDGTYKIKVIAYDKYGTTSTKELKNIIIDTTGPKCGDNTGTTEWTNKDRTIEIKCEDDGVGCKKTKYTKTFTETKKKGSITIEDNAGNKTDCPVNVYIDKVAPTCGTTSTLSSVWTKEERNLSILCSDDNSKCTKDEFTETFITSQLSNVENEIEIKDNAGNKTSCKVNVYGTPKVGDYVKMTPTTTSYTISTSNTGHTTDQNINPSQLNIWIIIAINDDGTIEMVSKDVSNEEITLYTSCSGDMAVYKKYVNTLNKIASQYKNAKYTSSVRAMGYNNQIKTLTTVKFPPTEESDGAGEQNYKSDISLVENAVGTLNATKPDGSNGRYWLASRYCKRDSDSKTDLCNGDFSKYNKYYYSLYFGGYSYRNNQVVETGFCGIINGTYNQSSEATNSIRPIVTLKSGLENIKGTGTLEDVWLLD